MVLTIQEQYLSDDDDGDDDDDKDFILGGEWVCFLVDIFFRTKQWLLFCLVQILRILIRSQLQ